MYSKYKFLTIDLAAVVGLLIMLFIVLGLWVPYFLFVAFAIQGISVLLLNKQDNYRLLFFVVPFALIYKYPGVSLSFLTLIQALIILVFMWKRRQVKSNLLLIVLLVLAYFLVRANSYYLAIPKLIIMYLTVTVFADNYTANDGVKYVDSFAIGMLLSSFLGIFKEKIPQLLSYYSDLNYEYIDGIKTLRFSGLFNDPNYFSIAIVSTMVMLVFMKKYQDYPQKKFWFFFLTLSVLGLSTYSKSFFLVFAFVVLLEVVLNYKSKSKTEFTLEVLVFAICLLLVVFGNIDFVNKIVFRFSTYQGVTTGRDVIWNRYLEAIKSDNIALFFGFGLDAPYVAGKAAHSLYIEMIYYAGIVGLLIFLASWVAILFLNHKHKLKIRNFILFAIILVMYAFLAGFLNYAFPFYMIFCWMLADMDLGEKKNALLL